MSFIPIPTRSEVVTRLTKDKNRAHTATLQCVVDKIGKAASLPIHFTIEELGPDADIQRAVVQALERAEWTCRPVMNTDDPKEINKKIIGYEVQ